MRLNLRGTRTRHGCTETERFMTKPSVSRTKHKPYELRYAALLVVVTAAPDCSFDGDMGHKENGTFEKEKEVRVARDSFGWCGGGVAKLCHQAVCLLSIRTCRRCSFSTSLAFYGPIYQ